MDFYNKYPYTDFHEMNLDWIIDKIKELDTTVNNWTALEKITWCGAWDISKNYIRYSIVEDKTGEGYLSLKPVGPGIDLDNTDYWVHIYSYSTLYDDFNARITNLEHKTEKDVLINLIYPIGSIYMSVVDINPNVIFGGNWDKIENKFLLGCSQRHQLGSTGGAETVTLTVNQIPSHKHAALMAGQYQRNVSLNSGGHGYRLSWNDDGNDDYTDSMVTRSAGGSEQHENMPPYIAVNIWKRTA